MDNPITQYIQHLIIDTVTAVTHLGTMIHIALPHKIKPQIKSQTQQTFYKKLLDIIKEICRKLINNNNNINIRKS